MGQFLSITRPLTTMRERLPNVRTLLLKNMLIRGRLIIYKWTLNTMARRKQDKLHWLIWKTSRKNKTKNHKEDFQQWKPGNLDKRHLLVVLIHITLREEHQFIHNLLNKTCLILRLITFNLNHKVCHQCNNSFKMTLTQIFQWPNSHLKWCSFRNQQCL